MSGANPAFSKNRRFGGPSAVSEKPALRKTRNANPPARAGPKDEEPDAGGTQDAQALQLDQLTYPDDPPIASEFILKPERSNMKGKKSAESYATRTRPKDTSGRLPRPASSLSPKMGNRSPPDRERSSSPPRERQRNVREEAGASAADLKAAPAPPAKQAPAPIAAPGVSQKSSAGEKSVGRRDRSGSPVTSRQPTGRHARREDPSYTEWHERSPSPPRDRDRSAAAADNTSARQKRIRARNQRANPTNEGRIALLSPSSPRSPQKRGPRGVEEIPWLELPPVALGSPQRRGSGGNGSSTESTSRRGSAESKQIVESRPPWNWAFWSRGKGPASGPLSPPGPNSPSKARGRSKSAESMQLGNPEETWNWSETATSPRKQAPIVETLIQPLLDRLTPGSAMEAIVYSTEVETEFPKDAPPELVERILEGAFGRFKEGRLFPQLEGGSQAQEVGGLAVAFEKPDIHFPDKGQDEAGERLVSDAAGKGYRIDDGSENDTALLRLPAMTKTEDRGKNMAVRTQYLTVAGLKGGSQPARAIQVKAVSAEEREVLNAVSHQMALASQEKARRRAAEDEAQRLREQVAAMESRALQLAAERKEELEEQKEGLEEVQKQLDREKVELRQKNMQLLGYEQQVQNRGQILVGQEKKMQEYEQELQARDDLLTRQERRFREMQSDRSWLEQSIRSGSGKKVTAAAAEEKKRTPKKPSDLELYAEETSRKIVELQQQINEYQDKLQSSNAGLMEYEAKVKEMESKLVGYEEKMTAAEQEEIYRQQVEIFRQQVEHERGLRAQLESQVSNMSRSDSASEQAEIYRQQVEHERGLREQLESQLSSMSRSDSASEQAEVYRQQVEIYRQQVEHERGLREQLESQVSSMSRSDSAVEQMSQENMALLRRLQQEEGRRAKVEVEVGRLTQEMSDLRSRIRESEGPSARAGPGEAAADGSSKGDFEDYNWVIDNYLFSPTKEEEGMARDNLKGKGLAIDPDKLGHLLESYHSLQKRYADLQQEVSKHQQAAPALPPVGSDELMRSLTQQYEMLESELEKQRDMQQELEACLRTLEHGQGGAPPLTFSSSGSRLEDLLSQEESRRLAEEAKVQVLTHQVEELQAKSVSKSDFEDQLVTVGAVALAQIIMLSYGFGAWFEIMLTPLYGPFPT